MKRLSALLFDALLVVSSSSVAGAHGGGTKSRGCHGDRATGEHHCHHAPSLRLSYAKRSRNTLTPPAGLGVSVCSLSPPGLAPGRTRGTTANMLCRV